MSINMSEILRLPVEERLRLVESIWDSIAECPEALELTDAQKRELDRRLDDLERTDEDAVVIVHVFSKTTAKTPKSIIETCKARLRDYDSE